MLRPSVDSFKSMRYARCCKLGMPEKEMPKAVWVKKINFIPR